MFSIDRPIPPARRRLRPVARLLTALFAVVAVVLGLAGPAAADSASVAGTGAITTMTVNNGSSSVVAKVFGPSFACDGSALKWVKIVMRDGDGTRYTAKGACYLGDPTSPAAGWRVTLERGGSLRACVGDAVSYIGTGNYWRLAVPRSCLNGLANRIKVVESELAPGPTPGFAGPTPWIARG